MLVLPDPPKKGADAEKSAKAREAYDALLEKVKSVQPIF